jgi:hypothetical protein
MASLPRLYVPQALRETFVHPTHVPEGRSKTTGRIIFLL